MKKLWKWAQENSVGLQGLAALVFIIGAVVAIPAVLWHSVQSDIVVRLNIDEDSLPSEIKEWLRDASRLLIQMEEVEGMSDWERGRLSGVPTNVSKKLSEGYNEFDKAKLDIVNQSNRVLTGIRLRLDRVYRPWQARASAPFLSNEELQSFNTKLNSSYRGNSIVFPELPALPPKHPSLF